MEIEKTDCVGRKQNFRILIFLFQKAFRSKACSKRVPNVFQFGTRFGTRWNSKKHFWNPKIGHWNTLFFLEHVGTRFGTRWNTLEYLKKTKFFFFWI